MEGAVMDIKAIFDSVEDGALTYEQFEALAKENGAKFTDLNEGKYVSKKKYEDELAGKASEIDTLNSTISTRDTDLAELQKKLEEVGVDADKLASITSEFDALKTKYDSDAKNYKAQLKKQAYEFAVKEFANSQKFSSNAAKRDFIQSMIAKDLKMENDIILGAQDFVKAYSENNEDAFIVDTPPEPEYDSLKPQFITSTPGADDITPDSASDFINAMHFTGVRPLPE